jgi:hypothetical protein
MKGLFTAAALSLALASPAAATIVIVDASSIQGENVLFNQSVQTGTSVQGFTNQSNTGVNFTGTTLGGGNTIRASGGQARVEGSLNTATQNPNDTNLLTSLTFGLVGGVLFNDVEFNLFGGTATSASFTITDNEGQVFNFTNLALGNGSNFFGFQGINGESIRTVSFMTNGGGIEDVRQIRLTAVPGPIAGAGLPVLMALSGLVWARRRKATAATA